MEHTPDETPRPSQAEGEPAAGAGSAPSGAGGATPRPSQAEGESTPADADHQNDPTAGGAPTSAAVGGRSRVGHGAPFRAGQTEPAAPDKPGAATTDSAPRPSQAEGELNPGATSGPARGADSSPRPSQAEGELDSGEQERKPA